ncbi:KdsC family phosphatase [Salinisphaera orenii]|uniref:3-deoxy-D-manno-octulosonate 8-phosphate phosphatase KdsC n=1 Tax=Salinisphaera orenii YIM 95161 TaxID=1051139 RepID=A0A423QBL1_9GAMM|nr:HAD hydrolase family protein [Salinisphaera halophila]ROO37682.1 HAD family hydrolase [Salinisphaera halophila YIM 95161]
MKDTTDDVRRRAAAIEVAVFDVDGVMTDGKLYLHGHGEESKTMHVHDGLGIQRLQAAGVAVAAISGRPSPAVAARLHALGVDYIYLDSHDKQMDFEALLAELELTPERAAVMGDDLPDLGLMRRAGLAMAVADAVPDVREAAHWISDCKGGEGAVREACELIIAARNAH